jgi:glutathione synthase/RimK-type ligase-like ATP-grasp enzyme
MILIAGIPGEGPVRFVIEAAEAAGIEYVLFDQHKAHTYELSVRCLGNRISGSIRMDGQEYELADFDGVFMRIIDYASLPERNRAHRNFAGREAADKSGLIHQYLLHWADVAPGRVMNRPGQGLSNISKPYQAQLIAACGFNVPPTCVTNDAAAALAFKKQWRNVIYKSVSSARSIVQELNGVSMLQLGRVKYLPTQFQQRLCGVNIRVHVAGDALFATKADTEVVDYRYAGREGGSLDLAPFKLPPEVEERCFALADALGLPLCGIDLFLSDGGDYYCFEANPSPGYSFFQDATGQDIAGAVVRWLDKGTTH